MGGLVIIFAMAQLALILVPFFGMITGRTEDERTGSAGMFVAACVSTTLIVLLLCDINGSINMASWFAN